MERVQLQPRPQPRSIHLKLSHQKVSRVEHAVPTACTHGKVKPCKGGLPGSSCEEHIANSDAGMHQKTTGVPRIQLCLSSEQCSAPREKWKPSGGASESHLSILVRSFDVDHCRLSTRRMTFTRRKTTSTRKSHFAQPQVDLVPLSQSVERKKIHRMKKNLSNETKLVKD